MSSTNNNEKKEKDDDEKGTTSNTLNQLPGPSTPPISTREAWLARLEKSNSFSSAEKVKDSGEDCGNGVGDKTGGRKDEGMVVEEEDELSSTTTTTTTTTNNNDNNNNEFDGNKEHQQNHHHQEEFEENISYESLTLDPESQSLLEKALLSQQLTTLSNQVTSMTSLMFNQMLMQQMLLGEIERLRVNGSVSVSGDNASAGSTTTPTPTSSTSNTTTNVEEENVTPPPPAAAAAEAAALPPQQPNHSFRRFLSFVIQNRAAQIRRDRRDGIIRRPPAEGGQAEEEGGEDNFFDVPLWWKYFDFPLFFKVCFITFLISQRFMRKTIKLVQQETIDYIRRDMIDNLGVNHDDAHNAQIDLYSMNYVLVLISKSLMNPKIIGLLVFGVIAYFFQVGLVKDIWLWVWGGRGVAFGGGHEGNGVLPPPPRDGVIVPPAIDENGNPIPNANNPLQQQQPQEEQRSMFILGGIEIHNETPEDKYGPNMWDFIYFTTSFIFSLYPGYEPKGFYRDGDGPPPAIITPAAADVGGGGGGNNGDNGDNGNALDANGNIHEHIE